MPQKMNILMIRCSDGRSREPDDILGNLIHEIRLPGGVLFPNLCAQQYSNTWKHTVVSKLLRTALLYAIDVMVGLKSPELIILMSHTYCGAAESIGLEGEAMRQAYRQWGADLSMRFPRIPIRVIYDRHSEDGEQHHGHVEEMELLHVT